ncbi:MAG: hypothetical protein Kow00133_01050 [Amphiplicatus sp.]|jgi:transposase-like protein
MKYHSSDKLEIIRMVEASHLGVKRTLEKIGVSRTTFYRWYDLYARFGERGLGDRGLGPGASGIATLTTFATTLLIWRWSGRSCPRAPSRC